MRAQHAHHIGHDVAPRPAVTVRVETLGRLLECQSVARRRCHLLLLRVRLCIPTAVTVVLVVLVVGPVAAFVVGTVVGLGLRLVVVLVLVRLVVVALRLRFFVALRLQLLVALGLGLFVVLLVLVLVGLRLGLVELLVLVLVGLSLGLVELLIVFELVILGKALGAEVVLVLVRQAEVVEPVANPVGHVADHVREARDLPERRERVELAELRRLRPGHLDRADERSADRHRLQPTMTALVRLVVLDLAVLALERRLDRRGDHASHVNGHLCPPRDR